MESFTYSLALALAGDDPGFETTASRELAQRLRAALRPHLEDGERIRPDFGSYAQVRIEGDLLDRAHPVKVDVEFEDQSVREMPDGRLLPMPGRRVHLGLSMDIDPCVIRRCSVRLANHAQTSKEAGG